MEPLRRAAWRLRKARAEGGAGAAALLLVRLATVRLPLMVLRRTLAFRRTARIRAAIADGRSAPGPGLPYLAFRISGGLGDFLVIARFVRDLAEHVGGLHFDVFAPIPGPAAWAFGRVPGFRGAYHDALFEHVTGEYDVALRANQFLSVYEHRIRWAALRARPRLAAVVESALRHRPRIEAFIDRHPELDNFLARAAVFAGRSRRDFLHHMAGIAPGGDALAVPRDDAAPHRHGLAPGSYVTVHNGFDPGFLVAARRATKCYPHFGAVVARVREARPEVRFVQIGTSTSEPIEECDLDLVNRTTLDEASGLIAGAALHLDNEGGLVHLAACLGTRSVVIFGPTPSDYFGYPGNVNVDPPVCGDCWWMTPTWMAACPKGYAVPLCMEEQPPERVAARVIGALGARRAGQPPAREPAGEQA